MKKDCGVHSWFYPLIVLIIGSCGPCSNTYVEMGKVVGKAFSDGAKLK